MKLSTKGRYGVAIIYELSLNYRKGTVSLNTISQQQEISEKYLQQLIGILKNNGYVNSERGAQGGFYLIKDPASISIGDIVRVMEGPIAPVDCLLGYDDENNQYCHRAQKCPRRKVWDQLGKKMNQVLDSISFKDMCEN